MPEDLSLKPGSRVAVTYHVTLNETASVEGAYKGMAMIGTDTALVLEAESGPVYVSASSAVRIDVLEPAPAEPKESGADRALYGRSRRASGQGARGRRRLGRGARQGGPPEPQGRAL